MKHLFLLLLLTAFAGPAFAQFPLGSNADKIKAYFDDNIPYASVQNFVTKDGVKAVCFTKVKVVGDYTFYFDAYGYCTSYVVTYDKDELSDLIRRFDYKFCRLKDTKWAAQDDSFDVTLVPPEGAQNYFSIIYKPLLLGKVSTVSLVSN